MGCLAGLLMHGMNILDVTENNKNKLKMIYTQQKLGHRMNDDIIIIMMIIKKLHLKTL